MKQFCIIGTGRSGSSLLANIMSHAEADFAMPLSDSWDPVKGDHEHSLTHRAYAYLHKLEMIENSLIPTFFFRNLYLKNFNATLNALRSIPFIKSSKLVYLIPYIATKEHHPKLIIAFRSFSDYARSRHQKYGWDMKKLEEEYVNAYSTALLELSIWGGVVIDFDDLLNPDETKWADSLADLCNLKSESLLHNRNDLLKSDVKPGMTIKSPISERVLVIENRLREIKNLLQ